jgi:large subunit ribosomal protein L16
MIQPARTKYRKAHKGRIHGKASRCDKLNFGEYGIKALQPDRIISNQIEAARVALTRYMTRTPEFWVCRVKPGRILFEVDGVTESVAKVALYKASAKLPIKTKFVKR